MRILYILLKNFKRFTFHLEETFECNFTSKFIVITGINGSGKSSLLNVLTSLLADKINFNKNGYKEIHIEKDNNFFKLIFDFTYSPKFYFYLNGENLNLSNNIITQRELVDKYFNITDNIHEILTGRDRFTAMSLFNRKKLFNYITNIKIDRILAKYNQLKEELKNNELLLKTQISLKRAEKSKLLNKEHLKTILNKQSLVKFYIDILLNIKVELSSFKQAQDIDTAYTNFKNILDKIKSTIAKYYTYLTAYYKNNTDYYNSQIEVIYFKIDYIISAIEEKQQSIKLLELNKNIDIDNLNKQINNLIATRTKLLNSLQILKTIDNIENIKNDLYRLEVFLIDILKTIPKNENKKYSKETYESSLNAKNNILKELNAILEREVYLNKEKSLLNTLNEEIKCPTCATKINLINSSSRFIFIKDELSSLAKKKLHLQEFIAKLDKSIQELTDYFTFYKQYSSIRNATHNNLKPVWDIVDINQYLFTEPEKIIYLRK